MCSRIVFGLGCCGFFIFLFFRIVYLIAIMRGGIGPWPFGDQADAPGEQLGGMQEL